MAKKDHTFKVVSRHLDYENPYMAVYKHEVVHPDDSVRPYWVLSRKGDFSIIIPIFPDGTTLLIRQYRFPLREYTLEFPMGKVEESASPLHTAKTELSEETGYTADNWENIGQFFLAPGFSSQQADVFIATKLTSGEPHPEDDEYLEEKHVNIEEVENMIADGVMKDGPSIIAFYFYKNFLRKNV